MKKLLITSFVALLLVLPVAVVQAQYNYYTNYGGGSITINGYGGSGGAITIPTNIDGSAVSGIAPDAFFNNTSLTSVTIPNSVTSIGQDAFSYCSLTNIIVVADNPAYSSSGGVLFDKIQVTLIQFPQAVTGSYAIPNSVANLGPHAFEACGLTSVTIPKSVTNIPNGTDYYYGPIGAFLYCNSLTNITVAGDNPAYSSSGGALFDKAQVTLIQFPAALTGSYVIPNTVTNIGNNTFAFSSLSSVTIPNSITSIGQNAFRNCINLTSVIIPNNVTSIGDSAFYYCTSLTNVVIGTSIGQGVFNQCWNLTSLAFSGNTTSIGPFAFNACISLASITIPNSVTNIGTQAFGYCFSLTNVIISDDVTTIGPSMFRDCTNLTNVTIPKRVTSIGATAFDSCTSLESLHFQGNAPTYNANTFLYANAAAVVYYLYGTTGWGATYDGLPTVLLNPPISNASINTGANGFDFLIPGSSNQLVVIEASTNLVNWLPLQTNTLTTTPVNFTDSTWTNYPQRFYRVRYGF